MNLLELPQEVVNDVLYFLFPQELVRLSATCKLAYSLIDSTNQLLWRSAFLKLYDDPEHAWARYPSCYQAPREGWDWHVELRRRRLAIRELYSPSTGTTDDSQIEEHVNTLLSIVDTVRFASNLDDSSQAAIIDDRSTLNLQLLADPHAYHRGTDRLIYGTSYCGISSDGTSDRWPGRPMTRSRALAHNDSRSEARSRLHVLSGLTYNERTAYKLRGQARRKIYDWSSTSERTDYGPFMDDGSGKVNWTLLEGAMSVICWNFEACLGGQLILPTSLCYAVPHRTLVPSATSHDWARAEGRWFGTYAFLDYAHLLAFNGHANLGITRPNLEDDPEACGDLLEMKLKLCDSVKDDWRLRTAVPAAEDPDYPTLYFRGQSQGHGFVGSPTTTVKGFAALVPGGREVRWKFIISYMGSDQWQLEGVQPGGVRSGGIYGLWSQVNHEPGGAVGPFCYFPLELCKETSLVLVS